MKGLQNVGWISSCHRLAVTPQCVAKYAWSPVQGQGLAKYRSFWRGMGVTLAKDVPFAAAYWSVLEPLRATMLPTDPSASHAQVQPGMGSSADLWHASVSSLCVMLELLVHGR